MSQPALFEDDRFLALDKPGGVSMATSGREGRSGRDVVARLLAAAGLPDRDLFLVHRLDVGTSGAVVLAKTREAHAAVTRAFQERRARKTYRALVWGAPVPARGVFDAPLARDPKDGRRMRVHEPGKPARTRYDTLRRLPPLADLVLTPETGRTHQIRVHLAAKGHPIAGDDLYGAATRWHGVKEPELRRVLASLSRPLLHAARLSVPELGLEVEAPLPADYEGVLTALSRRIRPDRG
jgi:23S rRNA pseudouridine1911/1915/1917 synthase